MGKDDILSFQHFRRKPRQGFMFYDMLIEHRFARQRQQKRTVKNNRCNPIETDVTKKTVPPPDTVSVPTAYRYSIQFFV